MFSIGRIYHSLPEKVKSPLRDLLDSHPLVRWYFSEDSYLRDKGWMRSEQIGAPVDRQGNPNPWYTYPAIDFVEPRLEGDFRVFEFGSGHSSLWYSNQVNEVVTVEDSAKWASEMKDRAPSNLTVIHQSDTTEYPTEVLGHGEFDIIVIDGRVRQECVKPTLKAISNHGVVILDDFERWDDSDWRSLREVGFRPIPFVGPKAQRLTTSCTAILYREQNCLGI